MLEAKYAINCHPARDFVEMTVAGFFTVQDVADLMRDQAAAYRELRCGPNRHLTLVTATGMQIQTQDVVAAFMRMTDNPATRARRLAVIVGSTLARLQTKRISERGSVRLFDDRPTALTWLFAEPA